MKKRERPGAFPSARQDEEAARHFRDTPQTRSPSYRLAFADPDFLLREDLRPVRLQLELLKPELALQEADIVSTIVVFGSARTPPREHPSADERMRDYEEARRFARLMSEREPTNGFRSVIVTGGGPGIMEAANRGAHDVGGKSIGLNITLPHEQYPNPYISPDLCFSVTYFAIRKLHFLLRAKALVVLPGGYGTLDELFETLTLIQTRKVKPMPVVLVGEKFWRGVFDADFLVEEGVIDIEDRDLFWFAETAAEAWEIIQEWHREAASGIPLDE